MSGDVRPSVVRFAFAAAAAIAAAAPVEAQQRAAATTAGPFARMVVIAPRPGQEQAFEAGYQRHLEWHRGANDPWTWFGWSFVLGERLGMFMDGTFGHAAADFDHSVHPAADAADNAVNVSPYAEFRGHGVYERLDALSAGAALPDTSAFLVLTTYRVQPEGERTFEQAVAARRSRGAERHAWYRLHIGGERPQYLLMRPASSWAAAVELPDFFGGASAPAIAELVTSVRTEMLRYRPTLSYHP